MLLELRSQGGLGPSNRGLESLAAGFLSISAWEASGTVPEPAVTGTYRGAAIETHLRPKVRLECVVGAEHVSTIVEAAFKHAAERRFVFVMPVEEVDPGVPGAPRRSEPFQVV